MNMRIGLAVLGLALAACRRDDAELSAALARYNTFITQLRGDSIAALYASDGVLEARGRAPLQGPRAIAEFLASLTSVHVDSSAMRVDSVVRTDSGIVQWGHFFQRATVAGQPPVTSAGGFAATWKRQSNGEWRIQRMRTAP